MIRIKICGLTREQDIEMVNHLRPDYVGFVFAPKSRRFVERKQASLLRSKLKSDIQVVGVFVNDELENILSLCQQNIIDIIQLHGQENENYVRELKSRTSKPVIQAYAIETKEDILTANTSLADYILLDHGKGGTGESFDWSLLQLVGRPFFLAGGLHQGNVAEAIEQAKATEYLHGVDTSSGVETNGVKDFSKIDQFIQKVRER